MEIALRVVQFWCEIKLVLTNCTPASRSCNFVITRLISHQIALHSVQLPLLIILYYIILYYIIFYYIIFYYIILYFIILHFIILYFIILYYVMLCYCYVIVIFSLNPGKQLTRDSIFVINASISMMT